MAMAVGLVCLPRLIVLHEYEVPDLKVSVRAIAERNFDTSRQRFPLIVMNL